MHLRGHAVQKTATLLYGLPAVSGEGSKSVMNLLSVLDIPFDEFRRIVDFYLIISAMSNATIIMAAIIRGVWAPFLFFACVNSASSWVQRFRESESISE